MTIRILLADRIFVVLAGLLAFVTALWLPIPAKAQAAGGVDVQIGFMMRKLPPPLPYVVDPLPEDEGLAGARVGLTDNSTTGRFLRQTYKLSEVVLEKDQSAADAAVKLADAGVRFLVTTLPANDLVAVADALKGRDVIVFNAGATDDSLRGADCRANVYHVAPSRAMLTDALVQYLAVKRWSQLFLITGPSPGDKLYAEALKRSAHKFGLKIAAEKPWEFGPLARARADSPIQAEALVFTRGTDYDIMIVADEQGDFGDYISYHTWDPKLVAGTQGLIAASWHRAQDAWGAAQLQSRFLRAAKRYMRPLDYQAWTAVRAIGEAVTRTKGADPAAIARFLTSPEFELAAFKGVPLSFRTWDHQLRQPLLLAQPMLLVSVSPQTQFLHQRSPLDSLGTDEPESACHLQ
jgi:ABC transporter substrate binding protein (PQQ-dependent alcohol dehydrogenase system)